MTDVEAVSRPPGPGTLYAALARLEGRGLIEALAPGPTAAISAERAWGDGAQRGSSPLRIREAGLRGRGTDQRYRPPAPLPARWRPRYGEEFAVLLPLGPLASPTSSAAHLMRGSRAARRTSTGTEPMLRIAGYGAIGGGLLWIWAVSGRLADARGVARDACPRIHGRDRTRPGPGRSSFITWSVMSVISGPPAPSAISAWAALRAPILAAERILVGRWSASTVMLAMPANRPALIAGWARWSIMGTVFRRDPRRGCVLFARRRCSSRRRR